MKDLSSPTIWVLKIIVILLFLFLASPSQAADPLDIVINEIAWMGTKANSSDEWLELYNNTNQTISLEGWGLYEGGGETLIEPLTGTIEVKSYYLIERTNDATINNILANQEPSSWGGYGLKNSGEHLQLLNQNSLIIDEVDCLAGWFAGEASPDYKTMERKNPQTSGSDPSNWATNNGSIINGKDAEGNPINGTPKAKNSLSLTTEPSASQPEPETELLLPEEPQPEPQPVIYPSGILINELIPSPEGPDNLEEWIELKNINNEEVGLSKWKIQDTTGSVTTYTFPEETKIEPKSFLLLSRPISKITLNNSGDGLNLIQPDGNIIDEVIFGKAPLGQSYNRVENKWVWSTTLTPGSANIITPQPSEVGPPMVETSTESQTKKEVMAAVGEQISPKETRSFPLGQAKSSLPYLIASSLAVFSGIIILCLKIKIDSSRKIK